MACWHFFQTPPPSSGWGLTSPSRSKSRGTSRSVAGWLQARGGGELVVVGPPTPCWCFIQRWRPWTEEEACMPGIHALYSCASLRSMKTTPKALWIEDRMVQSQLPHMERHQGLNLHGISPWAEYLSIILWEQRGPSQGQPRSTGARSFCKKPTAAWGGDRRERGREGGRGQSELRVLTLCMEASPQPAQTCIW